MGNILDMQRKRWYGHAVVPLDYFPPNVNYFNAYSIHNQQIEGQDPIYKALYPSSSAEPDFHDLESFRKFSALPLLSTVTENSAVWDDALANGASIVTLPNAGVFLFLACIQRTFHYP